MKPIRIIVLAVAAIAAIGLALVARSMMSGKPTSQAAASTPVEKPKPMARVLVAKRDLKIGERLTAEDLDWQEWPVDGVNPAFTTDGSVALPKAPDAAKDSKDAKDGKDAAKDSKDSKDAKPDATKTAAATPPKPTKPGVLPKPGTKPATKLAGATGKDAGKDSGKPGAAPAAKDGKDAGKADAVAQVTRTVAMLGDGGPKTQFIGAVVRSPILKGEPMLMSKVVRSGDSGYMAVVLPAGMRAMAVGVKVETAAGGFILPGDRVDVIMAKSVQGEGGSRNNLYVSSTVLRNIKVLAIDQVTQPDKNENTVVGATATLELAPTDAEVLALAKNEGELYLTLRSYADIDEPSGRVGGALTKQNSTVAAAGRGVRVFRNGSASNEAGASQ
jgi:pilus assembly protein CpaB